MENVAGRAQGLFLDISSRVLALFLATPLLLLRRRCRPRVVDCGLWTTKLDTQDRGWVMDDA